MNEHVQIWKDELMLRNMVKKLKKRTNAESRDSLLSFFLHETRTNAKNIIIFYSLMELMQNGALKIKHQKR